MTEGEQIEVPRQETSTGALAWKVFLGFISGLGFVVLGFGFGIKLTEELDGTLEHLGLLAVTLLCAVAVIIHDFRRMRVEEKRTGRAYLRARIVGCGLPALAITAYLAILETPRSALVF